ncbi:hypothetical protein QR680_008684 [Steinernema hermaphroditum]|uniref:Peptidase M13 C-terminal domain-containing protein n=1 Tax=Steinernema hermaphroditum TaxID=289476 RepID=A0AA39IHI3_9BILA|nr:hypothetical protein QR680_008684 [Steinernema hermaphroditum]
MFLFLLSMHLVPFVVAIANLTHEFSQTVGPCQDFHEHVCNFAGNPKDSLVYEMRQKFADDVTRLLEAYSDPIIDFARKVLAHDADDKYAEEEGKRLGREGAYGRFPMRIIPNQAMYEVQIELESPGKMHAKVECYYEQCPLFLKSVLTSYSHYYHYKFQTWKVKAVYPTDYIRRPLNSTAQLELHRKILETKEFNPYLNLVVAKLVSENGLWLEEEKLQKLERIFDLASEEIVSSVQRKWWILKDHKEAIVEMIRNVQPLLYLPKEARDPQSMKEALEVYQTEFVRNKDYLESLYDRDICDTRCLTVHLGRVIHQGMSLYFGSYHGTSRYIEFWISKDTQTAAGVDAAWGGKGKINVLPTILQYMHLDLPLGLLYSAAATVISHELLHNLDSAEADKEAVVLWKNPVYKEAFECYREHYASFPARTPDGGVLYPRGDVQKNEGFADVEGLRIALKVFKQMEPDFSEEDLRWFFYGVELFRCVYLKSDYELLLKTINVPHPRYTVRGKAQMTQTREFSDVFRCQQGDPMYVVEKPCELFVSN